MFDLTQYTAITTCSPPLPRVNQGDQNKRKLLEAMKIHRYISETCDTLCTMHTTNIDITINIEIDGMQSTKPCIYIVKMLRWLVVYGTWSHKIHIFQTKAIKLNPVSFRWNDDLFLDRWLLLPAMVNSEPILLNSGTHTGHQRNWNVTKSKEVRKKIKKKKGEIWWPCNIIQPDVIYCITCSISNWEYIESLFKSSNINHSTK